ncbi:FliH/SctL family protein [Legionella sp. km772]|uniref:FliH/SctL family protein n=1 Tax=Legionella sp. km772 TaxID=2498111 RepID=UPI000F8D9D27|nr:FliH/SctL family protein [Legionella sp. km772]RUR10538.1 flagellar assembly protein FliH [Legionella sp. km772]
MTKEFEPYYKKEETGFSAWEYKKTPQNVPVTINPEEEFAKECAQLREEARKQGYEEGLAKAKNEIEIKKKELIQWGKLLQMPVHLIDDRLTQELIQTIIWLSAHCIGIELSVHPEKLRELFSHIKDELPVLQADKVFAMHPDDIEWIKAEFGVSELPGLLDILVADPSLSRGDFYLKSEHSELDGRIQTRLITLFSKYINKDNLITPIEE